MYLFESEGKADRFRRPHQIRHLSHTKQKKTEEKNRARTGNHITIYDKHMRESPQI